MARIAEGCLGVSAVLGDSLVSTGKFLLTVVPLFALGVVLAQLFVELRWLDALSWLARPLMRLGHLHPECAGSFVVAVISPTAGHSMLARYHNEGRISRPELIISAIMNALPGYIAQGRSVLPVTMPLIGVFGLAYYGLVLLADSAKTLLLLAIGCVILPRPAAGELPVQAASKPKRPNVKGALLNSLRDSSRIVPKTLKTLIPLTWVAFLLIGFGVFDYAARHLGVVARYFPVPQQSLPVIAARLVSPIGAYTMAGGLLSKGMLGGKDIVVALLVGTLLATVPNVRYLVPYYFGIFGATIGTQLVIVSTLMRALVFAAVVGVVFLWA
jgi:hypothetical protein